MLWNTGTGVWNMEGFRLGLRTEVERQARAYPWLSDRAIARRVRVGHPLVGRVRRELGLTRLVVPRLGSLNAALLVWAQAEAAHDYDLETLASEIPERSRITRALTARKVAALLQEYAQVLDGPAPVNQQPAQRAETWDDVNQDSPVLDA